MKIKLTWQDFDDAIDIIVKRIMELEWNSNVSGIYGVPRGGLPLAVALSHHLDIPLIHNVRDNCLWVDDIIDTGKTLELQRKYNSIRPICWVNKRFENTIDIICARLSMDMGFTKSWYIFPWELEINAEKEQELFLASRL